MYIDNSDATIPTFLEIARIDAELDRKPAVPYLICRVCALLIAMISKQAREMYTALDNNNPKYAATIGLKHIKKHPDDTLVKALSALSLARLGKHSQSNTILSPILETPITNVSTLDSVIDILHVLHRPTDGVRLYEKSSKTYPENENLGVGLFKIYVRTLNFFSAYQQALALFKRFGTTKYYFWAIMALSNHIQTEHLDPTDPKHLIVDKMVQKALLENTLNTFQKLSFHQMMTKTDQTTSLLLSTPSSVFPLKIEEIKFQICLWEEQHNWASIYACLRGFNPSTQILQDWLLVEAYLDAVKYLHITEDIVFWNTDADMTALERQTASLAQIEVSFRFLDQSALKTAVIEYYNSFGHKDSCFSFIRKYLDKAQCQDYFADIVSKPIAVDPDIGFVCALKIHVFYRGPSPDLLDIYFRYQHTPTICSDLLMLGSLFLLDQFNTTRNVEILYEIAILLIQGLETRDNIHVKLLLILVLRRLGAVSLALKYYSQLDIKFIQMDLLVHLVLDWVPYAFSETIQAFQNDLEDLYNSNQVDTPKMIVEGYLRESYSQLPGLVDFYLRLNNSIQKVATDLTKIELDVLAIDTKEELIQYFRTLDIADLPSHFSDNRDLTNLFGSWTIYPSISSFLGEISPRSLYWVQQSHQKIFTLKTLYSSPPEQEQISRHCSNIHRLIKEVQTECPNMESLETMAMDIRYIVSSLVGISCLPDSHVGDLVDALRTKLSSIIQSLDVVECPFSKQWTSRYFPDQTILFICLIQDWERRMEAVRKNLQQSVDILRSI